ncbi:hypothetical protein Tco_0139159 [Tanacetum coccineum]
MNHVKSFTLLPNTNAMTGLSVSTLIVDKDIMSKDKLISWLEMRKISVHKISLWGSHGAVIQCHDIDGYNHLFHGPSSEVHRILKTQALTERKTFYSRFIWLEIKGIPFDYASPLGLCHPSTAIQNLNSNSGGIVNGNLQGDFPLEMVTNSTHFSVHESLLNGMSTSQPTLYSQVFKNIKDALFHEPQCVKNPLTFIDQDKTSEYTLDTTSPPLQHTSFPQDIPSTFIHDSAIIHDPLIHKAIARKNIQEANVTKKKDKEKNKSKLHVGFNLIILGLSLNDFVNDEFSEEEEIDDECENVKNIGKSLGIYIGENQKDFQNNITFNEFLQDLALHGKEVSLHVFDIQFYVLHLHHGSSSFIQDLIGPTIVAHGRVLDGVGCSRKLRWVMWCVAPCVQILSVNYTAHSSERHRIGSIFQERAARRAYLQAAMLLNQEKKNDMASKLRLNSFKKLR